MEQTPSTQKVISRGIKKNSSVSTKDYITIVVAVLLLVSGILISILRKFDSDSIEFIVFLLIAFSIGLLSFLMIGKIGSKEISFAGIKINQITGGFLIFILILTGFFGYKKITKQEEIAVLKDSLANSIQIENPAESSVWKDASGVFEWFNPPLEYAIDEHLKIKMNWFKNDNFQLRILLIASKDSDENKKIFLVRLNNLKTFITRLTENYKEDFNMKKHLSVKICTESYIPNQSFFTTTNWGNKPIPRSIFYLPLKDNLGKPSKSIVSSSKKFNETLHDEFEKHWENDAYKISLDSLLNSSISNTFNWQSIRSSNE